MKNSNEHLSMLKKMKDEGLIKRRTLDDSEQFMYGCEFQVKIIWRGKPAWNCSITNKGCYRLYDEVTDCETRKKVFT